jgi:NAD(P)-dependent dehydrogenase (short-subunit alcohol dehydrogenase family)
LIMELASCTVLVTGAASGLGEACARRFASQGAKVVLADRNAEAGKRVADEVGASAAFAELDVTDEASTHAAIEVALQRFGTLSGVIHCAGVLPAGRILAKEGPHDLSAFRRAIDVNLVGTFNVMRLAAQAMATLPPNREGERGVIVTTSSVAAYEGQIGQAAYAAAKGGVASLTLPAARELARFGIRVVSIAPGVFETSMMAGAPDPVRESLASQIPFPSRFGRPAEFAQLAQQVFENPMLNGCVLRLDGALRMGAK